MSEIDSITWNNSALSELERCGESFRRKYLERDPAPPNVRMVQGTAVHRVAADAHLRQMKRRESLATMTGVDPIELRTAMRLVANEALPTMEEAGDIAASVFEMEIERGGVAFTKEETAEGVGKAMGQAKDFAVNVSRFYVRDVAPAVNPVGVERLITIKPKDSDLVIHGTMDLIDETSPAIDDKPAEEVIRDQKTSRVSPPRDRAEKSQQLTMYHMLRTIETGREPVKEVLDYLVMTPKRGDLKHVPLETTRTMDDVATLVNRINTAVDAVKKGIFVPAHPESWQCSATWCQFFLSCKYVNGARRPAAPPE